MIIGNSVLLHIRHIEVLLELSLKRLFTHFQLKTVQYRDTVPRMLSTDIRSLAEQSDSQHCNYYTVGNSGTVGIIFCCVLIAISGVLYGEEPNFLLFTTVVVCRHY